MFFAIEKIRSQISKDWKKSLKYMHNYETKNWKFEKNSSPYPQKTVEANVK